MTGYQTPNLDRSGAGPGRPSLLLRDYDDETRSWTQESPAGRVIAALRLGLHLSPAAHYGGVSHTTLRNWLARGREHDPGLGCDLGDVDGAHRPYVALAHAVDKAVSQCEFELIVTIRSGCQADPKLALAFLGRRFPAWRDTRGLEVTSPDETAQDSAARALMANPALAAKAEDFALALDDALAVRERDSA